MMQPTIVKISSIGNDPIITDHTPTTGHTETTTTKINTTTGQQVPGTHRVTSAKAITSIGRNAVALQLLHQTGTTRRTTRHLPLQGLL